MKLIVLSIFIAFSFPLTTFADDTPPPADTTTVQPTQTDTVDSQSGDALVDSNSTAGDATSGDATADTTQATIVNSTVDSGTPAPIQTFTKDITGDSVGDVTLDPLITAATQPQTNAPTVTTTSSKPVTVQVDASHSVTVSATTGNATVSNNSTAGNATTGTAIAHANAINVINSGLTSQGSFIGTINIYGSLNGDILISPSFIPQLVGASTAESPVITSSHTTNVNTAVDLSALSGDASVLNNSTAGNATSGDAATNFLIMSIATQQLDASNSLIVFVNVLGKWTGTIVASPDGATTAFLATDITNNTATPGLAMPTNTEVNINNTIKVAAQSGNALVTNNSTAGNATSGKAMASANVLNLINDKIGLSGWLGVLFINVYGNWNGSFGINTANGDSPTPIDPVVIHINPASTVPVITSSVTKVSSIASDATIPDVAPIQTLAVSNDSHADVLGATSQSPISGQSFDILPFVIAGAAIIVVAGFSVVLRRYL
jgi:hypothetical protein